MSSTHVFFEVIYIKHTDLIKTNFRNHTDFKNVLSNIIGTITSSKKDSHCITLANSLIFTQYFSVYSIVLL